MKSESKSEEELITKIQQAFLGVELPEGIYWIDDWTMIPDLAEYIEKSIENLNNPKYSGREKCLQNLRKIWKNECVEKVE